LAFSGNPKKVDLLSFQFNNLIVDINNSTSGKMHNLIVLYYVASGDVSSNTIEQITGKSILQLKVGEIKIGSVVGSDLESTIGIDHPEDGVTTLTLWGELAY
jgi:hypothetical protein